VEAAGVNICD